MIPNGSNDYILNTAMNPAYNLNNLLPKVTFLQYVDEHTIYSTTLLSFFTLKTIKILRINALKFIAQIAVTKRYRIG